MGLGGSKQALEPQVVKEEKVQDRIDFSRLFKPKEEKVTTKDSFVETVKPKNKQETLRNGAVLALFGYIIYRAVEPVISKQLQKADSKSKKPKPGTDISYESTQAPAPQAPAPRAPVPPAVN